MNIQAKKSPLSRLYQKIPRKISGRRKAAKERIPGSIHKYVTGVSESSQRICGPKDDGESEIDCAAEVGAIGHDVVAVAVFAVQRHVAVTHAHGH